jgi:hypothetical protein
MAMWPFSRRRPSSADLYQLTELLLVKKLEAEARVEEARADAALKNLERELKLKDQQLAWVSEKRERQRQMAKEQRLNPQRRQPNRFGPRRREEAPTCGLCVDSQRRDVTLEMIAMHNQHGSPVEQQANGVQH